MRLRRWTPSSFVLVLLIAACGGSGSDSPTAPPSRARLLVTVHVLGETTPVADVGVTAQASAATTDANGRCTLADLNLGVTNVTMVKGGFVTTTVQVTLAAGDNTFSLALPRV